MDDLEIGGRARIIWRRRGVSLDAAAGLAGISKGYLSRLERGQRGFERRGLLEDLATALGCSVADLTGQPYLPPDRATADAMAAVPGIREALHSYGPEDVPDVTPRPLAELVSLANRASANRDQARYSQATRDVGRLLSDLQARSHLGDRTDRRRALAALIDAWMVTAAVAKNFGYLDLSIAATERGHSTARRLGEPAMLGYAAWYWALGLTRLGSRDRASAMLARAVDDLAPAVGLRAPDTTAAEITGLCHLTAAQTAARDQRADESHAHLAEAARIASRIGERNALRRHFGPTNIASWRLAIGIELHEGARAYADAMNLHLDPAALGSQERSAALDLDFARALAQEGGFRDAEAIRHLDAADRIAPQLIRPDPIARDLVTTLHRRARRRGVGTGQPAQPVRGWLRRCPGGNTRTRSTTTVGDVISRNGHGWPRVNYPEGWGLSVGLQRVPQLGR